MAPLQYDEINDPSLDSLVEKTLKDFPTPGMAVLIIQGTKIHAKGYGSSTLSPPTRVTPSTLFYTGSTTKSFTAALAAHLVESKEHPYITWETPMSAILPGDFVLDQSTPRGQWATTHMTLPMHRDMRTKFEYSNNPYTAVSCAVEKVLDRPFQEALKEIIFDPLEMHQTTYDIEDAKRVAEENDINLAGGYQWNAKSQEFEQNLFPDIPPSTGAGGIISNILDYARWVQHLMKPTNLTAALSENAVKAMRSPKMLVDGKPPFIGPQAYGFGLQMHTYRGREIVEHASAIAGYMANMTMVPPTAAEIAAGETDSGWAVVIMQNSYSAAQDIVCWRLLDDFLDTPDSERYDAAAKARKLEKEVEDSFQPDKIVERLYGAAAKNSRLGPALPLAEYEGVYEHPAYHEFQVSATPLRDRQVASGESGEDGVLYLAPPTSSRAYLSLAATLRHVNGEWWWAHQTSGPSSWMIDMAVKVQFVIGVDGKVEGMRYQAEDAMADELAFFKKIE